MATLVRRAASRFVGNYCKNRSFVYSFLDQSAYDRRRHLTPSFDRNVPFTTSTKKRASPTDPLLRIIETEIGYAEKADDYDRVNPNFPVACHFHVFVFWNFCFLLGSYGFRQALFQCQLYVISLFLFFWSE